MTANRVVIVDDSTDRAKTWAAELAKLRIPDLTIETPTNAEVVEAIKALNIRRRRSRKKGNWKDQACSLDGVDVLLIDFDLIELDGAPTESATGEEIAYLARVFSTAKVICVVNQFGQNRFDLTMKADLASRNDLDLGSWHVMNPGLWQGPETWKGFRPWHWPVLSTEVQLYTKRLANVRKNLKSPVLQHFGFDARGDKPSRALSREALSFFDGELSEMTFASVVESSAFVHTRDVDWLKAEGDQLERVSTAIVQKWLRKYVLIRQDILVDVPHLVSRKPWLLKDPKDPAMWRAATGSKASEVLRNEVQKFRFASDDWTGRPMYWGEEINANADLALPKGKWNYEAVPELVFREDTSTFGKLENSSEFDCALGTSYDMRFVTNPERDEKFEGVIDLTKMDYVPAIKLLM